MRQERKGLAYDGLYGLDTIVNVALYVAKPRRTMKSGCIEEDMMFLMVLLQEFRSLGCRFTSNLGDMEDANIVRRKSYL